MNLPVLMYHEIITEGSACREAHAVTWTDFKRQMLYLRAAAVRSVDFRKDFLQGLSRARKDDHFIGISFDDGHSSDFSKALPLLHEFGLKGIFFITLNWVNRPGHITWDELRQMNDAGMSIQSHGVTHRFLPRLNDGQVKEELRRSKQILENKMGNEVRYLSLPGGFGSKRVFRIARREGYSAVFTSEPCSNGTKCARSGVIGRFNVTRLTSDEAFQKMAKLDRDFVNRLRRIYKAKGMVKCLVGSQVYHLMWGIFKRELR